MNPTGPRREPDAWIRGVTAGAGLFCSGATHHE